MFAKPHGRHAARTSLLAQLTPPALLRVIAPLARAVLVHG